MALSFIIAWSAIRKKCQRLMEFALSPFRPWLCISKHTGKVQSRVQLRGVARQ